MEFFGNKPFTQHPERAISQADQLLDYKSWSEEDRKMFSQLRMREEQALLAYDYALETARAEGIEQGLERGLERGRAEGIEQGLERGKLFAFPRYGSSRSSDFGGCESATGYVSR